MWTRIYAKWSQGQDFPNKNRVFTFNELMDNLDMRKHNICLGGAGVALHNALAERVINTIFCTAQTLLIHAAQMVQLWPNFGLRQWIILAGYIIIFPRMIKVLSLKTGGVGPLIYPSWTCIIDFMLGSVLVILWIPHYTKAK